MTIEKQIEILMEDRCTKSEAEKQLKNGTTIFDDLEEKKRNRTQAEIYIQIYAQSRLYVWYNVKK